MKDRIITLTTDFGISDAYAGIMKGVILGINPEVHIVDISHEIEPQNVAQAAYLLNTARPYFPDGTIHVVVVDPGVGSSRKALLTKTPCAYFIAPDNGVLEYIYKDVVEVVSLTNSKFQLTSISNTFHGRDIFAPAAAHLSLDVPLHEFGEPVTSFARIPQPRLEHLSDGGIAGQVIHIDRFGNLITNILDVDIPHGDIRVEIKNHMINGLSSSYIEGRGLVAIIGSSGNLEISLPNGNAAEVSGAECGDFIKIGSTSLKT